MEPETTPPEPGGSTTAAPADLDPQAVAMTARAALDSIRALFDQLVPPETVEIRDAFGGTYTLRSQLPARAQVLVVRHLERLADEEAGDDLRAALSGRSGIQAAIAAIVRAASNDLVMKSIAAAFQAAHPEAVAEARKRALSLGAPATDAADLFGVEEMAAGLIPFCIGLLRRLVGLFGEMLQPAEN